MPFVNKNRSTQHALEPRQSARQQDPSLTVARPDRQRDDPVVRRSQDHLGARAMIGLALLVGGGILVHRGHPRIGATLVGLSIWIGIFWAVAQVAS